MSYFEFYGNILENLEFLDTNDGNFPSGVEETIIKNINDNFDKIDINHDLKKKHLYHYYEKMMKYVIFVPTNIIKKIYVNACLFGKIKIVKSILTRNDAKDINKFGCNNNEYDGFDFACKNGYIEIVKLLIKKFGTINEMNSACDYYGVRHACDNGHIETAKLLLETFKDYKMITIWNYFTFKTICKNGYVELLKLVVEDYGDKLKNDINKESEDIKEIFNKISNREEEKYKKTVEILVNLFGNAIMTDENKKEKWILVHKDIKIKYLEKELNNAKKNNFHLEDKLVEIKKIIF